MSREEFQKERVSEAGIVYRDQHLGFWSSHPHWLSISGRWLSRSVTTAVFACYCSVVAFWLRTSGAEGLRLLLDPELILQIALILAFLTGMSSFASLQTKVALAMGKVRTENALNYGLNWPVILTTLVIGFVIPVAFVLVPELPFEVRLLGALLAFLPLLALDAFLRTAGQSTRFPVGALLIMSIVALFLLFSIARADVYLAMIPASVLEFFPRLKESNGLVFALTALQFLLIFRFAVGFAVWVAVPGRESLRQAMERVFGFLFKKETEPLDDAPADGSQRDSLQTIVERLEAAGICASALGRHVADGLTDGVDADSCWKPFFPGQSEPTRGQSELLNTFNEMYASTLQSSVAEPAVMPTFLVEGSLGSGRTTVLEAAALISAVIQGRPVLFLTSNKSNAQSTLARLKRWTSEYGFGKRLRVGDEDAILEALRVQDMRTTEHARSTLPIICVTVARKWEELVFDTTFGGGISRDWARVLLQHYSVLVLDDWSDHPDAQQPGLPFLIDQMRMVQAAECVPGTVLVSTKLLGHEARAIAGRRFLAPKAGRLVNCRLLPRQLSDLYVAQLSVGILQDEEMPLRKVKSIIEDLNATLRFWRPSHVLLERTTGAAAVASPSREMLNGVGVYSEHEALKNSFGDFDTTALALLGSDQLVLFINLENDPRLLALPLAALADTQTDEELADRIPVFVHEDSGFARNYLIATLRTLKPGDALPFDYIARAGGGNFRSGVCNDESIFAKLFADLSRPDDNGDEANSVAGAGSYASNMVILDQVASGSVFARYGQVFSNTLPRLRLEPQHAGHWPDRLVMSAPISKLKPEGLVVWKQFGSTLGYSQLQYQRRLVLESDQTWRAGSLRSATESIEIDALPYEGDSVDFVFPRLNFAFTFDDSTKEADVTHWTQRLVSESCMGLYDKADKPVLVEAELMALARWSGEEKVASVPFSFHEHVSMFFMAPSEKARKGITDLMIKLACQAWSTREECHQFLPAFTQALYQALSSRLGSLASYGRVIAFEFTGELREFALGVVFVLEPQAYGRTLSEAVNFVFSSPDVALRLTNALLECLHQWETYGPEKKGDFWLPVKQRVWPDGRDFNIALALRNAKLATLNCPHCGENTTQEMPIQKSYGEFCCAHCSKRMHLVPTENNGYVCPTQLVQPWWPAGVDRPEGATLDKILAVWSAVSERITYTRDHHQPENLSDCWFSAAESWRRCTGDCEDHSILVVSMLRALDVKAWLVWGRVDPGGCHAWVEVLIDAEQRVLEATAKALPPDVPTYQKALETYQWQYAHNTEYSGRTDGKVLQCWRDSKWVSVYGESLV